MQSQSIQVTPEAIDAAVRRARLLRAETVRDMLNATVALALQAGRRALPFLGDAPANAHEISRPRATA